MPSHIGSETSFSAPAKPTSDPKSVRFQDSGGMLGLVWRSVLWLIKNHLFFKWGNAVFQKKSSSKVFFIKFKGMREKKNS